MLKFRKFITEDLVPESGTQYGSNPGGIHHDSQTGEKFYVKRYKNPDQGKVEALTGKIYEHMGVKTVQPEVRTVGGHESVVTKWNDNLSTMHPREYENLSKEQHHQIGAMYHAAVLTHNWDIVGLEHDNILKDQHTGQLHAIDHGGAFHFRARGGPKEYGPDIDDYKSLRHNDSASGHVFDHVLSKDPEAEKAGFNAVRNMDMDHVKGLFQNSGLSNWKDLHQNFTARRDSLLKMEK